MKRLFENYRNVLSKRYKMFHGRASRGEYWYFILADFLASLAVALVCATIMVLRTYCYLDLLLPMGISGWVICCALPVVYSFATLIPRIALSVRRMHDIGKSGWILLLWFIPYAGGIIVLIMSCLPGTKGGNRFGPENPYLDQFDVDFETVEPARKN